MPTGARLKALTPVPLTSVPTALTGGVVAVGNFDGVHPGHVALVDAARAEARRHNVPALVLTFEPHPRTVFRPDAPVFRLTPLAARARLLTALALDGLVVARFDRTFAARTAEAFIEDVLVGRLKLAAAVVGFNFRFGAGRAGSPDTLMGAGRESGFSVTVVDEVSAADGARFSSSDVRRALAAGDIVHANGMLGYRWFVTGTVAAGDQRGRTLGYPTANLALGDDCQLRYGVYAVRLGRADGAILDAVANFGRRPTFDNGPPLLEVHAFDFSGDLYNEEVVVTFFDWIRAEERFPSAAALVAAMDGDGAAARSILAAASPGSTLDAALAAVG